MNLPHYNGKIADILYMVLLKSIMYQYIEGQ